jgi:hypothetical protein
MKIKENFEEAFKFLVSDYNFTFESTIVENWGYESLYLNGDRNVGVKVTYEYRESYVFIMIYRLINGVLKEDPKSIDKSTILNSFSLDDIINLENPSSLIKPSYEYPKDSIFFDEEKGFFFYLKEFADNLKTYGKDVLKGNFEIFPKLDRIVKERNEFYNG